MRGVLRDWRNSHVTKRQKRVVLFEDVEAESEEECVGDLPVGGDERRAFGNECVVEACPLSEFDADFGGNVGVDEVGGAESVVVVDGAWVVDAADERPVDIVDENAFEFDFAFDTDGMGVDEFADVVESVAIVVVEGDVTAGGEEVLSGGAEFDVDAEHFVFVGVEEDAGGFGDEERLESVGEFDGFLGGDFARGASEFVVGFVVDFRVGLVVADLDVFIGDVVAGEEGGLESESDEWSDPFGLWNAEESERLEIEFIGCFDEVVDGWKFCLLVFDFEFVLPFEPFVDVIDGAFDVESESEGGAVGDAVDVFVVVDRSGAADAEFWVPSGVARHLCFDGFGGCGVGDDLIFAFDGNLCLALFHRIVLG